MRKSTSNYEAPDNYMALKQKSILFGALFMGLGHIFFLKQRKKGITYMLIELVTLFFVFFEVHNSNIYFSGNGPIIKVLRQMTTLGGDQSHLPVKERLHAMFILNDGLIICLILAIVALIYVFSLINISKSVEYYQKTGILQQNSTSFNSFMDRAFPWIGLTPTVILLAIFVLLPLLFSALIAFTDYSVPHHLPPANRVNWVGVDNFVTIITGDLFFAHSFSRVLVWTITWALLATATTFLGGFAMTLILRSQNIKLKGFFRSIFILPYAIPGLISIMVWANLLNGSFGPINAILKEIGLISTNIPWLTEPTMAKISMVCVNLWLGFPYQMLMTSSIMTSISEDIFEAGRIDGANHWQMTQRIYLPLVLRQAMPLLIMSFCANFNNFGLAYMLTNGNPPIFGETAQTRAGATDIIISWIYKLTYEAPQQYQYAAVLSVIIFLILTPFAIFNYKRTKSYKESDLH